ncbi:MAG: helix-turn-helix domain-containing protein [Lachnospiraceae bacterium]|nr:helix-turn-helix domain-containing protein [Lachnospiraceae bacterium]
MITTQILRNCIDDLSNITKANISVYDQDGKELYLVGDKPDLTPTILAGFIISPADSQVVQFNHLLKVYDDDNLVYVVNVFGSDDNAYMIGKIAVSNLNMLINAYKEKLDKNNYFQNLLMDNMLLVDVYNKARKLHVDINVPRVVFVISSDKDKDNLIADLLKGMFSQQGKDYVTKVDEDNHILIKALEKEKPEELEMLANTIVDTISAEIMVNVRVGYGMIVDELKDVSKSYKEALMAIDVGRIFYAGRKVNSYSSLGIGRLIYQLPAGLCQMFIEEIFKDNDPAGFDEEIVSTIYKFFENNLNVSETSRQMFIHRNTLVYRVEKLKAITGLDVRVFDDALTFMIAMMVYNYLKYLESEQK